MLDTDICIFIRSGKSQPAIERLGAKAAGEAVISVVTYGELATAAFKSARPDRNAENLERLIERLAVHGMPVSVGLHYGEIRAHLERRGERIGNNDFWIAAHARAAGLVLVTNNERDFRRVPGLAVENWAKAEQGD